MCSMMVGIWKVGKNAWTQGGTDQDQSQQRRHNLCDARNIKYPTSIGMILSQCSFGICAWIKFHSVTSQIAVDWVPTLMYVMGAIFFWLSSNLHAFNLFRVAIRTRGGATSVGTRLEELLRRIRVLLSLYSLSAVANGCLLVSLSLSTPSPEQREIALTVYFAVGAVNILLTGLLTVYRNGLRIIHELELHWRTTITSNQKNRKASSGTKQQPMLISVLPFSSSSPSAPATGLILSPSEEKAVMDSAELSIIIPAGTTTPRTKSSPVVVAVAAHPAMHSSSNIDDSGKRISSSTRSSSSSSSNHEDAQTIHRLRVHIKEIVTACCANVFAMTLLACWPMARQFAPYIVLVITSVPCIAGVSAYRVLWSSSSSSSSQTAPTTTTSERRTSSRRQHQPNRSRHSLPSSIGSVASSNFTRA